MARPTDKNTYKAAMDKAKRAEQTLKKARKQAQSALQEGFNRGWRERRDNEYEGVRFQELDDPAGLVWAIFDIGLKTKDGKNLIANAAKEVTGREVQEENKTTPKKSTTAKTSNADTDKPADDKNIVNGYEVTSKNGRAVFSKVDEIDNVGVSKFADIPSSKLSANRPQ